LKMQPLSHAVVLPLVLLTHGILWSLMAYECYRRDLFIAQQLSHGLHPMQL
jgi:hypothetical protein